MGGKGLKRLMHDVKCFTEMKVTDEHNNCHFDLGTAWPAARRSEGAFRTICCMARRAKPVKEQLNSTLNVFLTPPKMQLTVRPASDLVGLATRTTCSFLSS